MEIVCVRALSSLCLFRSARFFRVASVSKTRIPAIAIASTQGIGKIHQRSDRDEKIAVKKFMIGNLAESRKRQNTRSHRVPEDYRSAMPAFPRTDPSSSGIMADASHPS